MSPLNAGFDLNGKSIQICYVFTLFEMVCYLDGGQGENCDLYMTMYCHVLTFGFCWCSFTILSPYFSGSYSCQYFIPALSIYSHQQYIIVLEQLQPFGSRRRHWPANNRDTILSLAQPPLNENLRLFARFLSSFCFIICLYNSLLPWNLPWNHSVVFYFRNSLHLGLLRLKLPQIVLLKPTPTIYIAIS